MQIRRQPPYDHPDYLVKTIQAIAHPLESTADQDALLEAIGDARCVLLGEATHATSEFYGWRARISNRLIREKGS